MPIAISQQLPGLYSSARPVTSRLRSCRLHAPRTLRKVQRHRAVRVAAEAEQDKKSGAEESVEATTQKYGLEAGLWKVMTSKDGENGAPSKGMQAKDLLKKYGSAYLITSISLSVVSFGIFYALVYAGVDVAALLQTVGLEVTATNSKVGTAAIAYAAHKAASPIRFPPTVALTPIVAKALGKEVGKEAAD